MNLESSSRRGRSARIELDAPAEDFTDAFLLGNGWLGAAVHGGTGAERFDLNIDTLWSGGPLGATGAPASSVQELRDAIRRGDIAETERLALGLQSSGYTQSYLPLAHLEWSWCDAADGRAADRDAAVRETMAYLRHLDLAAAEAHTRVGDAELSSFVSAPDGVLVATAPREAGSGAVVFGTELECSGIEEYDEDGIRWLIARGRAPRDVVPLQVPSETPLVYDTDGPDADGTVAAGMGWAVAVAVMDDLHGRGRRMIVSAETGFRGWNVRPSADLDEIAARALRRVRAATVRSTAELRARHREDYGRLFDRVVLDLAPSEDVDAIAAQRYFDLGRYLLISSSRPGSQAANLQGIWNADLRAPWSSGYTTNINLEMNYWGAEVAGLAELQEPLFTLIEDLADAGGETARAYYGARGAAAHHNTDLWRFTAPVAGRTQWSNWQTALGWLSAHLYDHLDFAWSDELARARVLPVLRAAGEFLLDNLVEEEAGLVVSPSTSPEHEFTWVGGTAAVTHGAALDQELTAEALRHLVAVSAALGEEDELVRSAAAALARLALPAIDEDGRIAEWATGVKGAEPGHRHLSHLYGLFPGSRITDEDAPEAFEAVRRSLAFRLESGSGYTGWSQAWILCLAARLGDRDLASSTLQVLLQQLASSSLLDLHPFPWNARGAVFQIDGNLGAIAGIAELLLQSHRGVISLLPTLPVTWRAGTIEGLRARGGATVSIEWAEGALVRAEIETRAGGPHTVEVDGEIAEVEILDGAGDPVFATRDASRARTRFTWSADEGTTYTLRAQR